MKNAFVVHPAASKFSSSTTAEATIGALLVKARVERHAILLPTLIAPMVSLGSFVGPNTTSAA
jgi:hypothetical protein